MRHFIIVLLFASTCFAQERYYQEEFNFSVNIPEGWYHSLEEDWPESTKKILKRIYTSKTLLMFNPLNATPSEIPCIQIQGKVMEHSTTSQIIDHLKIDGEDKLVSSAEYLAKDTFGKKINGFQKVDTFYDYNSQNHRAIAKIVFKNPETGNLFVSARAKFIGARRAVDLRGYWTGQNPDEFWGLFNEFVDSFEFDPEAKVKIGIGGISQEVSDIKEISPEAGLRRIFKWGGIILGVLIVLGIFKSIFSSVS